VVYNRTFFSVKKHFYKSPTKLFGGPFGTLYYKAQGLQYFNFLTYRLIPRSETGGVIEALVAKECSTTSNPGSKAQPGHPLCAKAYCLLMLEDVY